MKIVILCLLCCTLHGCHHSHPIGKNNTTYITKDQLKHIEQFDPQEIIDSCTYIPLETSERVLLGRIEQLKVTDQHIFLINGSNDSLYIFDRQGKFLNTIGTRGRGPREYVDIHSYCVSPQSDTVIIFDFYKLIFYTLDNHFIRTVNLGPHLQQDKNLNRTINAIYYAAPGKLLFKYDLMYNCKIFYSIYDYTTDQLKDIASVPISFHLGNARNRINISFLEAASWNNQLSCAILYNDTIFQYHQDSLSPRFVVNALQDKIIPRKVLKQLNDTDPIEAARILVSSGIFIKNIYETDSHFFVLYNGRDPLELIWNKKQHRGMLLKLGSEFYGHTFAPMAVPPLAILNDDDDYFDPNNGNQYCPALNQEITIKSQLHEEDNPVVVIYHLKPNF